MPVAGDAPAGDDGAEVEAAAQLLARIIKPPAQADAAVFGVDEDIDAIEHIAVGIVIGQVAVADDVVVFVAVAIAVVIDDHGDGAGHHTAVILDADLAFGEAADLRGELLARPGAAQVGVDGVHDVLDVGIIRRPQMTQPQVVFFGGRILFTHAPRISLPITEKGVRDD